MNTEEALRAALRAMTANTRAETPEAIAAFDMAERALALPTSTPPVPTVSGAPHDALDVIAAWRCVGDLAWQSALKESDCNGEDELLAQRRWQRRAIQIIAAHVEATVPVPTVSQAQAIPGYEPPTTLAEAAQIVIEYAEQFMEDWQSDDGLDKESRANCDQARDQLTAAENMLRDAIDPALSRRHGLRAAEGAAMSHTPGPWSTTWNADHCAIDPNDGHGPIARLRLRKTKVNNTAEISANARLITAAPELLAACRAFLSLDLSAHPDKWNAVAESTAAAIAKAEGKAP